MNCPRKRGFFAAVPLLSFFVVPLLGQEPTPPKPAAPPAAQEPKPAAKQQGPAPIRITTSTVVVPVTVKDRSGNLVPDLRSDESREFEDNLEQDVTRVSVAADVLNDLDSRNRRMVILLISDGQNGAKFNTHSYDETKAELLRQGISVYSVATGSSYFERKFNRLVSYSHDTGGDIYYGAKQNAFSEFYTRITEEARNQYTLTYSPRGERSMDYHSIEVRVRRDGLTILAPHGYYGGPLAACPQERVRTL